MVKHIPPHIENAVRYARAKPSVAYCSWTIASRRGELEYPFHDHAIQVTACGSICMGQRKINLSTVFAGQYVGVREVADQIWLVSFLDYDLGFFDEEVGRVEPAVNPFIPEKV